MICMVQGKVSETEKELLEKGWIRAWMLFEVQALDKDVCSTALKAHIEKVGKREDAKIADIKYAKTNKLDPPEQIKKALSAKGIKNLYSQVGELIVLVQNFESLVHLVINYGPTAIEITAPDKIVLNMREAQGALANVTDMMHKFASAGAGGMLISGE